MFHPHRRRFEFCRAYQICMNAPSSHAHGFPWKQLLWAPFAAILAIPFTIATAVVITPLLWKLEPVLGIELAGHSGPSDWILYVIWALFTASLFAAAVLVSRRRD